MSALDIIKLPPDFNITRYEHIDALPRSVVCDLIALMMDGSKFDYTVYINDRTILANVIYNIIQSKARMITGSHRHGVETMSMILRDSYTKQLKELLYNYDV